MRILLPLIIVLSAACNSQPTSSTDSSKEEAPPAELKILDLKTFKMKTPLSWTYKDTGN
jgi:hypothetical protein